ncbi:hypothetical protein Hypma_012975 [Hypsizygus marmoreus]|uniref:Uncharacterized protein n=1 Tax=Hypsizygus marmoreus TaxID=39966 RepID=A0A369JG21_HYPMA|nr:hypothetical protein Hypma_012975 [Hypsizygus marmoreus]
MDPQHQQGLNVVSRAIPRNTVAYVGGINAYTRTYMLCKDDQMIIIQAQPLLTHEQCFMSEEQYSREECDAKYQLALEYIQNLLPTIEFGKTNWGYLVKSREGTGYEIVQKSKRLRKRRCPLWAPLIDEKEITYTKFWFSSNWGGYWKGREVEVVVGWDDYWAETVEWFTLSHWALRGLDITYEVLGHLVEPDGTVVGIVTEAETGRLVQYRDRPLVYDAISRIQQRGLIYTGIERYNIHILNGKVRLSSNLGALRYYGDPAELERKASIIHWKTLEKLFAFLNTENDPIPRPSYHQLWDVSPELLPAPPSPERRICLIGFAFYPPENEKRRRYKAPGDTQTHCHRKEYILSVDCSTSKQICGGIGSPQREDLGPNRRLNVSPPQWGSSRHRKLTSRRLLVKSVHVDSE